MMVSDSLPRVEAVLSDPLTDSRGPVQKSSIDGPFQSGMRNALFTSSHTTSTRN
jgi:hypothetical protein